MNSNKNATEISFLDYLPIATDAELVRYTARYRARYRTRTDNISQMHAQAVKTEIARRARRAR